MKPKSLANCLWRIVVLFPFMTAATLAQDKPNVVLMLADNVGYGDIGAFQGGEIRGMPTPRIDRLASEGLTLTGQTNFATLSRRSPNQPE